MSPPLSAEVDNVRILKRPNNRSLGVSTYGDPDGFPVLAFHGVPGTRLMFRPAAKIAASLGLRVIAPDRPGFGLSSPQTGRHLKDWLPELGAILDVYKIDRFALLGISGGSPFATVAAARFGRRVAALCLFGPMGPVADMAPPALSWYQRHFFLGLAKIPSAMHVLSAAAIQLFRLSPPLAYNIFLKMLPRCDRTIMRTPKLRNLVIEDVRESIIHGGAGICSDVRIYSQPWEIDYAKITAPTVLWQGLDDTIVPVPAAMRLGELIPRCTVERIPGAGHFWIYDHIELVLTRLRDMAQRAPT